MTYGESNVKPVVRMAEFVDAEKFLDYVKECFSDCKTVEFDERRRGVVLRYEDGRKRTRLWRHLGEDMEWFDSAELVTDGNDDVKVLVYCIDERK